MDLIYFLWLKKRTADQEVPGSNSFATFGYGAFYQILDFKSRQMLFDFVKLMDLIYFLWYLAYGFVGGIAQW